MLRLVTRGDLDGLACAVIIRTFEPIDDVVLTHPQQITDNLIEITGDDILANVPYHPNCRKWFDHHLLTKTNVSPPKGFDGRFGYAPSAAQLVWSYYGEDPRFERLVLETSRFDSARLSTYDVVDPQEYIALGFTLDPRSGLGEYKSYFFLVLDWLLEHMPIHELLRQEPVQSRLRRLQDQDMQFREVAAAHSRLDGNVIVTDFRPLDTPPVGNRFLIYALHPEANVEMRIQWGPRRAFLVVACGHSIFNRTCRTNLGVLMSKYGGGGHVGAGSTPIPVDGCEERFVEILAELKRDEVATPEDP